MHVVSRGERGTAVRVYDEQRVEGAVHVVSRGERELLCVHMMSRG